MTAGVNLPGTESGYPSVGTRNISACIGNRVCPFANADTTSLALRLEKEVYPNDYHVKIAITGCPNDCIKAHLHDFGVICQTEPQYDTYAYIDQYINKSLPKEHVGYIFDRTGYAVFKYAALKDTPLNPEAHIAESIRFSGYEYEHGSGRPA